jgi:hypothetical protein
MPRTHQSRQDAKAHLKMRSCRTSGSDTQCLCTSHNNPEGGAEAKRKIQASRELLWLENRGGGWGLPSSLHLPHDSRTDGNHCIGPNGATDGHLSNFLATP